MSHGVRGEEEEESGGGRDESHLNFKGEESKR